MEDSKQKPSENPNKDLPDLFRDSEEDMRLSVVQADRKLRGFLTVIRHWARTSAEGEEFLRHYPPSSGLRPEVVVLKIDAQGQTVSWTEKASGITVSVELNGDTLAEVVTGMQTHTLRSLSA